MSAESDLAALAADAPIRRLAPGETLVTEGEPTQGVFVVETGRLEILRGPDQERIDTVGPGATLGEVALLAGGPRTATVRALGLATVREIPRDRFEAWIAGDDARVERLADLARHRIDRHRLLDLVSEALGVDTPTAVEIAAASEWTHLAPGETLFELGDVSDAAYLVVSGRLTVEQGDEVLREVARGEILGELGMIDRAPRSATVVALRETTLARFDVDAFRTLTETHPAVMLQVSRSVLGRLVRPPTITDRARTVAVAVSADLDVRGVATPIADELARHGSARHLWLAAVDDALGQPGTVESGLAATRPAMAELLHEAETEHDYLLLEVDPEAPRWTSTALALADRVLVVSSAQPDHAELARISAVLAALAPTSRAERWLALVHPADTVAPAATTSTVADDLGFDRVTHLRAHHDTGVSRADVSRLARLVSGNATGLVLSGGGARGFAHIGVWRALGDLGIEVDAVGGASIGSTMGMLVALEEPPDAMVTSVKGLFKGLLDYTIPVVSLIKGRRIARAINRRIGDIDIRDTWLPYFCVSTNLTRSRVEVHDRGHATTAIRASVAIPGIMPPVPHDGDLLVDGGVLDNLPIDVLRATGTVSRLIAVDLAPPVGPRARDDYGLSVSGWRALLAGFGLGRTRYPRIFPVLMRATVAASMRERDQWVLDGSIDCYLDLELRGVGMLEFDRVPEIAARGHEAALPLLAAWQEEQDDADPDDEVVDAAS